MSAEKQKSIIANHVRIACSRERLKRMVAAAQGLQPDDPIEPGTTVKQWELIGDEELVPYVNFANIFLYTGGAVIQLVDKEPEARRIVV